MSPEVAQRLDELRTDFDRSFAEPARRHDEQYAELLAVRAGGHPYALMLSQASGLFSDRPVTPLPGPQPALLGLAGFSGSTVPVYDLAALLGHPQAERPRWLVLAAGAPPLALAFHELDGHFRLATTAIVESVTGPGGRDLVSGMVPLPGGTRPLIDLAAARAVVHGLTGHPSDVREER